MQTPEVKPGDPVLYVAHIDHARDCGMDGEFVFEFEHAKDGPMRKGKLSARMDDKADLAKVGKLMRRDPATGHIETAGGHIVRPTRPKAAWRAVVLAVKDDGTCDLLIDHPHGHKLEYPGVSYSAGGDLHSWHLVEKGA